MALILHSCLYASCPHSLPPAFELPMNRLIVSACFFLAVSTGSFAGDIDREPINYAASPDDNVVTQLMKKLDSGETTIPNEKGLGYLRGLLRELKIPESSQVLVFSKTSLQRHRISPTSPRALYFNDDVYVGFCQNGDVAEVSATDPKLGTVFYTLNQKDKARPRFTRQNETCMICHASSQNDGFPGHLVRSVFTDGDGLPLLASGTYRIDQNSPLNQRWGGWYVTGTSGKQTHLGNKIFEDRTSTENHESTDGVNVTDLKKYFDTKRYLTPHSDIVVLMVLEHQAQMHNLITRANFLARQALYEEVDLNKAFGRTEPGHTESTIHRIQNAGEPLVRYMLFSEEAQLTDKITGTSKFTEEFAKRGPFDKKGRSLRDFDLQTRLFKYPCSYLVYSPSFDQLPQEVKEYVYKRLWTVLTGTETSTAFIRLSLSDRQAIREILLDTKPGLPAYWRESK